MYIMKEMDEKEERMKKGLVLLVLLAMVFSVVLVAGCGEEETKVKIGDEEITITEDGDNGSGSVTVDGDTYTWEDKAPSEDELGVAIYPDAEYVKGSGGSGSISSDEGSTTVAGADFTTEDSFDKVVAWYTDKYGEPMYSTGDEATWMPGGDMTSGEIKTISVTDDGDEVTITIGNIGGM